MIHRFIFELTDESETYNKTVERMNREIGIEEVGDIITIESVMKILSKYKLEESKIAEEIKENKQ